MLENRKKILFMVQAGIIAAIYYVLTLAFSPISYGPIQFRVSEILVILPIFTPAAIPGVTLGCFLANLNSSLGAYDYIFGTLATLIAAVLTYVIYNRSKNYWISMVPPVVVNAIIIGYILTITIVPDAPVYINMLYVGLGELIIIYVGGTVFKVALEKVKAKNFLKL